MTQYIKAAFFFRPRVHGLGHLPVNILALTGFAILGLGHPAFWLLGLGLEVGYLFLLATNDGFRRYVDLQRMTEENQEEEAKKQRLIGQLSMDAQRRYRKLEEKCIRIMHMRRLDDAGPEALETDQFALKELLWVYLKLLVGQKNLVEPTSTATEESLQRVIHALEKDLEKPSLPQSVKDSKTATLKLTQKRLRNINRRAQHLEEIASHLQRIEAQIDLALEDATMRNKPEFVSTEIEIAGTLLADISFGDAENEVAELDATLQHQHRMAE